jgi:FtsP/CotA-like multicopper oxidase with cupredoxin domain
MVNGRTFVVSRKLIKLTLVRIPTIEADVGDTIVVTAHNNLGNETTSLHFHGMYQKGSGIYDGVRTFFAPSCCSC